MYNPQHYSQGIDDLAKITRILFQNHVKYLKWNLEPESILDLGIGEGKLTKEAILPNIPQNINEYIGADISETMLNVARETISHIKFKTIQFDARTETLPADMRNRFHHIFSNNMFHHIPNIRPVLKNIKEMLKPNGQLLFNVFDNTVLDRAYDELDKGKWSKYNNRNSNSPFYKYENPLKEYETLIESLGYVDCHFHLEPVSYQLPEDIFDGKMTAVNHRLSFVEEVDREEYIRDYLELTKKGSKVKVFADDENKQNIVEVFNNIITGVVSKPAVE